MYIAAVIHFVVYGISGENLNIYIYMIYEILKLAFFPVIFYLWQNMIIRDSKHQYYGKEISIY